MAVRRDSLVLRTSVLEVSQGHLARHSPKLLTELFTVKVEILSRACVKVCMPFFSAEIPLSSCVTPNDKVGSSYATLSHALLPNTSILFSKYSNRLQDRSIGRQGLSVVLLIIIVII